MSASEKSGSAKSAEKRKPRLWALSALAACVFAAVLVAPALAGGAGADGRSAESTDAQETGAHVSKVPGDAGTYVPGELIVGLVAPAEDAVGETATTRDAIESLGFDVAETLFGASDGFGEMLLVKTDGAHQEGDTLAQAAQDIAAVGGVKYVQPNYRMTSQEANDGDVGNGELDKQWYLKSWEESHGANVIAAWENAAPASKKVDVAVLDTGMYTMTEYNDGELVTASEDNYHQEFNDSNLDMADARDFVNAEEGEPLPLVNEKNPKGDDNGHGTHVAAIIAANSDSDSVLGNDPYDMDGVSPNARIIPIKVLDSGGEGDTADIVDAYQYLLGEDDEKKDFRNLHVVNLSVSVTIYDFSDDEDLDDSEGGESGEGDEDDEGDEGDAIDDELIDDEDDYDDEIEAEDGENQALREVIQRAQERNIITVCAAGNEASSDATYPSDFPECVSVMALNSDGVVADFSNISTHKDISAPGVGIYSAFNAQADAYRVLDGTSQATAIVSGALSMMYAVNSNLTVDGAKEALDDTTQEVAGVSADELNGGSALLAAAGSSLSMEANGNRGAIDVAAALDAAGRWSGHVSLAEAEVVLSKTKYTYSRKSNKPTVKVTLNGTELKKDVDFSVKYQNTINAGKAKVIVEGINKYSDSVTKEYSIARAPISGAAVTLAKKQYVYTSKKLAPAVTVKLGGRTLKKGTDYVVSYSANVNPGTAKATVCGRGNYTARKTVSFKIVLGTTKLSKLTALKQGFDVVWTRQKSGNVGYQVQYSLKKSMGGAVLKPVTKNATTKLRVSKLKSKKTYYVRVRTYKKIAGKMQYSAWSAVKKVMTK